MDTKTPLHTLASAFERNAAYWGERGNWLVAMAHHRDSDTIAESNWRVLLKQIGGESDRVAIERASHWAVGWVEYLVIHPEHADGIALAEKARVEIESYPILDETDHSEPESDEANTVWRDCYNVAQRVEYIRQNRMQFEFSDFADILGCVRGNYFAGYASELLN